MRKLYGKCYWCGNTAFGYVKGFDVFEHKNCFITRLNYVGEGEPKDYKDLVGWMWVFRNVCEKEIPSEIKSEMLEIINQ